MFENVRRACSFHAKPVLPFWTEVRGSGRPSLKVGDSRLPKARP